MTIKEFSLQFDILYDNINSKSAPGIDEYEKSVYLTKAQLELVKEYNGLANKYQTGFDGSEKRRVDLKELIKDHISSTSTTNNENISDEFKSKFFVIPNDVFLIKRESGILNKAVCGSKQIDIVPVTLDEFNEKKDNPFRKPYKCEAWRLDYSSTPNNNVEIVSTEDIDKYKIRYVKFPEPIILNSLIDFYGDGENLTINGKSSPQTCKLNQEIHSEILDRAVELATRDYRENSLQGKIQTNNRNN